MGKTFSKNTKSATNQRGHLTNFIELQRDCRQGDPLSFYIFIICVECLAIRIRNNKLINGICMNDVGLKFADDTTVILDGSAISLSNTMKEIEMFGKMSGLKININKTQLTWKYSTDKMCFEYYLVWGKTKFCLLGIYFDVDLHTITKLNCDKKNCLLQIRH